MRLLTLLVCFIFTVGCATVYKGPGPNLSLRGQKAQDEIQKFHLVESYWHQGRFIEMGPHRTQYTIESLKPIIADVSPEAAKKLDRADGFWTAQWASLLVALGFLGLATTTSHIPTQNALATVSILSSLTSIGIGLYWPAINAAAARDFNRDLEQKFKTPMVGFSTAL